MKNLYIIPALLISLSGIIFAQDATEEVVEVSTVEALLALVKEGKTCLGLEYFVDIGDDLWSMEDNDLITLATTELETLSLIEKNSVLEGYVVRMPKAASDQFDFFSKPKTFGTAASILSTGNFSPITPVEKGNTHCFEIFPMSATA